MVEEMAEKFKNLRTKTGVSRQSLLLKKKKEKKTMGWRGGASRKRWENSEE